MRHDIISDGKQTYMQTNYWLNMYGEVDLEESFFTTQGQANFSYFYFLQPLLEVNILQKLRWQTKDCFN